MSQVQGKYLRDENDNIFSPITATKSILINKETSLYSYIKNKEEIPIYTKVIYSNQSGLEFGHNAWVNIANFIYSGFGIPQEIPLLPGFKRYVRMNAQFTDNINGSIYSRGMVIASWDNQGNYGPEWSFNVIWGGLADRAQQYSLQERELSTLPTGHLEFKVIIAGEVNSDALAKLYYLELQYLDRLEE